MVSFRVSTVQGRVAMGEQSGPRDVPVPWKRENGQSCSASRWCGQKNLVGNLGLVVRQLEYPYSWERQDLGLVWFYHCTVLWPIICCLTFLCPDFPVFEIGSLKLSLSLPPKDHFNSLFIKSLVLLEDSTVKSKVMLKRADTKYVWTVHVPSVKTKAFS